jgi:hypothetical protein
MAENIFGRLFARFVETVHVELPNKAVNVSVPEILGQNSLLELLYVFDGEFFTVLRPLNDGFILFILRLD